MRKRALPAALALLLACAACHHHAPGVTGGGGEEADLGFFDLAFNALSYIAEDQVDQGQGQDEILVAANLSGDLLKLDPKTGKSTPLGNYGGPMSSGDLVSVKGLGTLATVKLSEFGNDYLARVDF